MPDCGHWMPLPCPFSAPLHVSNSALRNQNPESMTTNEPNNNALYVSKKSRRDFLRGGIAAGAAAAMSSATHAFAAGGDEIKIGLVGCGGRGSGAAGQALSSG